MRLMSTREPLLRGEKLSQEHLAMLFARFRQLGYAGTGTPD